MKVVSNTKLKINKTNNVNKASDKNNSKFIGEELNSFMNQEEQNHNYNNNSACEKCSSLKENYKKAISIIKNYVDSINERLNNIYHKVVPQKKTNILQSSEMDYSISPEFYHTLYYSEIDKFKLNSETSFQLRSLMKSIRLFNDKFDYMSKKHENFEKVAQEYKNLKISNKTEDIKSIPEYNNEIKNLEVQKIFQNFNQAKESFENTLKDIKQSLNSNERNSIVNYLICFILCLKELFLLHLIMICFILISLSL